MFGAVCRKGSLPAQTRGVTLMELMTVMVIIAILAVLIAPGIAAYRERARRIGCTENLKGLYTGATAYLTSNNGRWPQIRWSGETAQGQVDFAREWYAALKPYGIAWSNYICPSVQARLQNPDFTKDKNNRTDYMPAFFDDNAWTATRWAKQPWFAERQDMHGGNLFILSDGSLIDIHEARRRSLEPQNR